MFEAAELGRQVDKQTFKDREPELRLRLLEAQRKLRASGRSVVLIVAGVEGAGKSAVVNRLSEWLDTRGVQTNAFWEETEDMRGRPFYWRFWQSMPRRGCIGIMFGSWYTKPIVGRVTGELSEGDYERELRVIEAHERMLVADGAILIKLWFHLPKDVQAQRLAGERKKAKANGTVKLKDKKAKSDGKKDGGKKARKAKAKAKDKDKVKVKVKANPILEAYAPLYDSFRQISLEALQLTDTAPAPWHVVEASDARYRDLMAGEILTRRIDEALSDASSSQTVARAQSTPGPALGSDDWPDLPAHDVTILDRVDLSERVERDDYDRRLKALQARVGQLAWELRDARRSVVFLFEGWDAAGKGGAIRRLVQSMDARLYQVIPVAAPTDEEAAQHYLWRFWRHLPLPGRIRIFDRSWYGRVLVERVEGFAEESEWRRAYQEINAFERQLHDHGYGVAKFWLHFSKEEQLRRFEARQKIPWKKHKITEEDWRNRERWEAYKQAVNEMVARTSTDAAPWTLVPSEDKLVARLWVLETAARVMERTLRGES